MEDEVVSLNAIQQPAIHSFLLYPDIVNKIIHSIAIASVHTACTDFTGEAE